MIPLQSLKFHIELLFNRRGYEIDSLEKYEPLKKSEKILETIIGINATGKILGCVVTTISITDIRASIALANSISENGDTKISNIIFFYEKSITPDAKQAFLTNAIFQFEAFTYLEMLFDPIKIVPSHSKIDEKPKDWKKFPIILSTDIIARYYQFRANDIIKIVDEGIVYYRRCV